MEVGLEKLGEGEKIEQRKQRRRRNCNIEIGGLFLFFFFVVTFFFVDCRAVSQFLFVQLGLRCGIEK